MLETLTKDRTSAEVSTPPSAPPGIPEKPSRTWFTRIRWVALAAVGLAVSLGAVLFAIAAEGDDATGPTGHLPLLVTAREIALETGYSVDREYAGVVEPARQSRLGFERAGKVTAVLVDEGQPVSAGAELATRDTEQLLARRAVLIATLAVEQAKLDELIDGPRRQTIDAAKAEVTRLEAQLRRDRFEAQRAQTLYGSASISEEERDRRSLGATMTESELTAAKAALDELEAGTRKEQKDAQQAMVDRTAAEIASVDVDVRKSTVTAPYDGVIGTRMLDEGRVIMAGEPVLELMEMGRLEARIGVAGFAGDEVGVGQEHTVRLRTGEVSARVKAVRPDRQMGTRAVSVLLELIDPPQTTRSGDIASLKLSRRVEEPGVWLPIEALTEGARGLWICYAIEPLPEEDAEGATHRLVQRDLEVLYQADGRAFVRGTIADGDRVVVEGLQRLTPGLHVRVAEGGE